MRENIIQAALEEVKIHALRFKMDDVAARLQMSKKTLYTVFSSKVELVNAVIEYIISRYNQQEKKILGQNTSGEHKTCMLLHLYSDSFWHFDRSLYMDLRHDYAEQWQHWTAFRSKKTAIMIELLEDDIRSGHLRNINIKLMMHCIWLVVDGLYQAEILKNEHLDYGEALEQYIDMIFNGIKNNLQG